MKLEKMLRMTPREREKYLTRQLHYILKIAYEKAPAIRKKFDTLGIKPSDIRTIKDLEKLPVTRKDELVKIHQENPPFGGFLTVPEEDLDRIFISPGPIYDPGNVRDKVERPLGALAALASLRIKKGMRVINTFSYHLVPAGLWIDEGIRYLGGTVIPTGVGFTELQIKIMHDLKVEGYVGTPSFLNMLIKKAEEMGYDFRRDFQLKYALLGAEAFPPSLRKTFEEDYGIISIETYGTADLGLIAYDCGRHLGLHLTDNLVTEIVDPATGKQLGPGETGEVVGTTFREVYPLIRFGTGDLSYYTDEPCPCGMTSPRLVRIVGRVGEAIKIRGMFVHPRELEQCMSKFPQAARFQLTVDRVQDRDSTILKVELGEVVADKEQLSQEIQKRFPEICHVKLDSVEFVPSGTIPAEEKIILDLRKWE